MALVCTHASIARVDELMRYKAEGFTLPDFAGYTTDQWGIKAHNRPWIAEHGRWAAGLRIIELGGAYSRLPEWLAKKHGMEAWVGDDFGAADNDPLWSRWGDPHELPERFPDVTYRFENFGPGSSYPDNHFDRVFSVSTLEHIPHNRRVDVLRDAHRTLAPGGIELHTVDVRNPGWWPLKLVAGTSEMVGLGRLLALAYRGGIASWWKMFAASGVDMSQVRPPNSTKLLRHSTLFESVDVAFRFIPPNGQPKAYWRPAASLCLIIENVS